MFATAGCRTTPQNLLNMITDKPPPLSFAAREPKSLRGVHKILVFQGNKGQKPQGIFRGMRTSLSSRGPNMDGVLST